MSIAFAHVTETPPVTFEQLMVQWTFDPTILLVLVIAFLYFRGIKYYRFQKSFPSSWWRSLSFTLGIGITVIALCSPLDAFADHLFWVHMIQHMLVMMVAAPLILIGLPLFPVLRGFPKVLRTYLVVPLAQWKLYRKFLNFLVKPPVAIALYVLTTWMWHHPFLYDLALHDTLWHFMEHGLFFWAAVLFWWNIIDPLPLKCKWPKPLRLIVIALAAIQNSALGAALASSNKALYAYGERGARFGFTALEDQTFGGALMWIPGAMMYLIAFSIIFFTIAFKATREDPLYKLKDQQSSRKIQ